MGYEKPGTGNLNTNIYVLAKYWFQRFFKTCQKANDFAFTYNDFAFTYKLPLLQQAFCLGIAGYMDN